MAYERVSGPLGRQYSDDMLANVHEQLQVTNFILGRMASGEESPIPVPERVLRPHQISEHHEIESYETDGMDLENFGTLVETVQESRKPLVVEPEPEPPVELPGIF